MRILLTGGAGCGKSTYGLKLAGQLPGPHYHIACMEPLNEQDRAAVLRNRRERSAFGFVNLECYRDVGTLLLPRRGTALLECLCNLSANELFCRSGSATATVEKVYLDIQRLSAQCEHLLVITNEIGGGGEDITPEIQAYITALGRLNRLLAADFEVVVELVCGIAIPRKGRVGANE